MINNNKKISILFVIDGLSFGGGERVFAQIINRLSAQKYDIFLVSQPNQELYYMPIRLSQVGKPLNIYESIPVVYKVDYCTLITNDSKKSAENENDLNLDLTFVLMYMNVTAFRIS